MAWVAEAQAPPASVYPKLAEGMLGSVADYRRAFPKIHKVVLQGGNLQPPRLDLGPRFPPDGIADRRLTLTIMPADPHCHGTE